MTDTEDTFNDNPYRSKLYLVQTLFPVETGISSPLPDPYEGQVFHYTDAYGVEAITRTNQMLASHIQAMNDPSEREFGWKTIQERYEERVAEYSECFSKEAQSEFGRIFAMREEDTWYPEAFAISASTRHDSLDQFRMYGMFEIRLPSRVIWTQTQPERCNDPQEYWAVWREVIYGADRAAENIDRLLDSATYMFDQNYDPTVTNSYYWVATAIEALAMYIKHEAYASEQEVRLVFTGKQGRTYSPGVRVSGGRLVTFHTVTPESEGYADVTEASAIRLPLLPKVVQSVHLGPLATDRMNQLALSQLAWNHQYDVDSDFEVTLSKHPYRMAATK